MRAITTTPPTTPPIMAPKGFGFPLPDGVGVGELSDGVEEGRINIILPRPASSHPFNGTSLSAPPVALFKN